MDSAVFNNIKKYITENRIVNAQVFWLKIKLDRQYEFEQYILKNPKKQKANRRLYLLAKRCKIILLLINLELKSRIYN